MSLPRGRPPAPLPSDSPGTPPKPNPPPVAAPRTNVSSNIAKRWPPLANQSEPPALPQPRSPATSTSTSTPRSPATPPLPSRRSPELAPSKPPDSSAPPLPRRPPEPLPAEPPPVTGPTLPKRDIKEPLPPLPSDTPPSLPMARKPSPGPPIPVQRKPSETLPPVQSRVTAQPVPPRSPAPASPTKFSGTPVFPKRSPAPMANGEVGPNSFGKCLQGATEAIGKRHEDELIALESLRFHIFNRARQDKAYADELLKTNTRSSKKAAAVSNSSSPIFKAWQTFLELSENMQKQISNGAAQMSGVLLSTVDQIIRDKRGAKTVFDRELAKIDKEKKESSSRVTELKKDYRHYVKKTETFKEKLEVSLAKDPPKPQEQDRARKKFVGSADKLHSTHNEYCLSILNANRHMEHHRHSLAPFTLDTLQQRMELQIGQWKDAMTNYAKAIDLTQTYQELFERLYESLNAIDERSEYSTFVEDHTEEDPPLDFFAFEGSLLESQVSPRVEEGKVVINNLTHSAMKTRLAALEDDLAQHTRDMEMKSDELKELMSSSDEDSVTSPPPTSPSKEPAQQPPKHIRIATLNGSIRELECLQSRKQEQATLIKEAVEAMGDDTPPLFDALGEGVDVSELAAANVAEAATTDGGTSRRSTLAWGNTMKGMRNAGSRLKKLFGGKKKRGQSLSTSAEEPTLRPSESHDTIASSEGGGDESDDSMDTYDQPPDIPVEEEEWYFGDIDRRLAENKCKNEGDYLVRHSERQNKFVLTCKFKGAAKHFVIQVFQDDQSGEKQYRFESRAFSKIRFLLDYHTSNGVPVTRASGAVISKYISKYDKWELQRDEIKMGKKIGKGAFGDVFEATYLRDNRKVAVKTCRSSDVYDMEKFMQEADILKGYQHPNIVSLIGVCSQKDQVYIVMEFMPGGAFLDFLRKKGAQQPKKKLCGMVIDAAKGMVYLEEQHCIHRDLAARNCLVGDEDIVKIADFGMSRESEDSEYTVQSGTRAIPIKWTAPEALNYGKYTPASDIWSFGILLWETYSCGSAPYPGMNNQDARMEIENGYRMSPPADCPQEVYGVMQQCWQYDPEERPDFKTVLDMLQQAHDKIKN